MKLIITIPAFNEARSLAKVISAIPRTIPGISTVEVLVYDDGSTDDTVQVARKARADHVYSHHVNRGLAQTFKDAVSMSVKLNADIIVNTDADNQYDQKEIPLLVEPILTRTADMVIGNRQVENLPHMIPVKKYGNRVGSFIIRALTGTHVKDASSGFRAMTRECAETLSIVSRHTYTHETIIDAHFKGMKIVDVPVTFRPRRDGVSRLMRAGVLPHILKSTSVIIRTTLLYRAFAVFTSVGSVFLFFGILGVLRYLYFAFILGKTAGHIQSLIISCIVIVMGSMVLLLGFIADLISYNRRLIEDKKQ